MDNHTNIMKALAQVAAEINECICENCKIVPITLGSKYCDGCAVEITDWLFQQAVDEMAEEVKQQQLVDRGLY